MLSCGHEKAQFGAPLCSHLRTCRQPWLEYVKWYKGSGLTTEFICVACAEAREKGLPVEAEYVCEECFEYATREVGDLTKVGGQPEILISSEQFEGTLQKSEFPYELGKVVDIAPVCQGSQSVWLLLTEDGRLYRFDARQGETDAAGAINLPVEVPGSPFRGHTLNRRLHASQNGEFAAVVNDYGRYGQVVDLRSGKVNLTLDGGEY